MILQLIAFVVSLFAAALQGLQQPLQHVKDMSELVGRMPDELERARYFDVYGSQPMRRGFDHMILDGAPPPPFPPPPPSTPPTRVLEMQTEYYRSSMRDRACRADAIVVARALKSRVFLNSKRTFLFTDFDVAVNRWVKPTDGSATILVSQAGGEVLVGNRLTRSTAGTGNRMEVGNTYVLFLRTIPRTTSFARLGEPVLLENGKPSYSPRFPKPPGVPVEKLDLDRLLADIQSALGDCKGADT